MIEEVIASRGGLVHVPIGQATLHLGRQSPGVSKGVVDVEVAKHKAWKATMGEGKGGGTEREAAALGPVLYRL